MQCPSVMEHDILVEKIRKQAGGASHPLNVHLRQEIDRFNALLSVVKSSLLALSMAIEGVDPLQIQLCFYLD